MQRVSSSEGMLNVRDKVMPAGGRVVILDFDWSQNQKHLILRIFDQSLVLSKLTDLVRGICGPAPNLSRGTSIFPQIQFCVQFASRLHPSLAHFLHPEYRQLFARNYFVGRKTDPELEADLYSVVHNMSS